VLTGNPETSYCDVGMLLQTSMREGSEIAWIDVDPRNYWWTSEITGIRFQHPEQSESVPAVTETFSMRA
jgi:hypothetical protein